MKQPSKIFYQDAHRLSVYHAEIFVKRLFVADFYGCTTTLQIVLIILQSFTFSGSLKPVFCLSYSGFRLNLRPLW